MSEKTSQSNRRQFLKLAGLAPAAGAAVALSGEADAAPADGQPEAAADYRETDHVKNFYRLARF